MNKNFKLDGLTFSILLLLSPFASPLVQAADGEAAAPSPAQIIEALKKSHSSNPKNTQHGRERSFKEEEVNQAPVSEHGGGQPAEPNAVKENKAEVQPSQEVSEKKSISVPIQFDSGSVHIAASSLPAVNDLAEALKSDALKNEKFTIVGHTDGVGSAASNLKLSQRRAIAVKAYLVQHGVQRSHLKAEGKGMSELKNKKNPRAAENRRVEIITGE